MTAIRDAGEERIEVDCHDQNVDEVYQNCARTRQWCIQLSVSVYFAHRAGAPRQEFLR